MAVYIVTGPPRSGKTTVLMYLLMATRGNHKLVNDPLRVYGMGLPREFHIPDIRNILRSTKYSECLCNAVVVIDDIEFFSLTESLVRRLVWIAAQARPRNVDILISCADIAHVDGRIRVFADYHVKTAVEGQKIVAKADYIFGESRTMSMTLEQAETIHSDAMEIRRWRVVPHA